MDNTLLQTFRRAYRDLELFPLLSAEQIEAFRIDYGKSTLTRLEQAVKNSPDDGKLIFAGHRGCGKSTLLARFSRQMMQQGYFVVYFSISDLIEMSDVNHVNVLYAIALSLLGKATERQVAIPETSKKALLDWFTVKKSETSTTDLKSEIGIGGDWFQIISAKLKNESTFREEIKREYKPKVSELVQKANEIAALIEAATQKKILVVIDDLDKLDLDLVDDIYRNNINSLFLPEFRIIFTIPISVIRNSDLLTGLNTLASHIRLMAVSKFYPQGESHNPDAIPIEETVQIFLDVLDKRIPADLIEPSTKRQIVLKSGGVIRELVRIARECCDECIVLMSEQPERQDIKINDEILALALKNLRNAFARPLGQNRYAILIETYNKLSPPDGEDPDFLSLLHGLYVLEYENDDLWYDVHPIVVDLLKRKKLVE